MRSVTIILIFITTQCYPQLSYEELLANRLSEIKELTYFNNNVVSYKYGIGFSSWDRWEKNIQYYEYDVVLGSKGRHYRALVDNKGKIPDNSPDVWVQEIFHHPYYFLRDTARTEDLKKLLVNENSYIKTYAFAALASRQHPGLYEVVIENLGDKSQISQLTEDYGYDVHPADLMITYILNYLSEHEKKNLLVLIETDYPHLQDAKNILSGK